MSEQIQTLKQINVSNNISKPEYDDSRVISYEVTFRNLLGIKMPKIFTISFQQLQLQLSEIDNAKIILSVPAANIQLAMPSQNVDNQVTILTKSMKKEAYKIWAANPNVVKQIITDINKLVQLYQDRLVE